MIRRLTSCGICFLFSFFLGARGALPLHLLERSYAVRQVRTVLLRALRLVWRTLRIKKPSYSSQAGKYDERSYSKVCVAAKPHGELLDPATDRLPTRDARNGRARAMASLEGVFYANGQAT